jgi:hypothetical protein
VARVQPFTIDVAASSLSKGSRWIAGSLPSIKIASS